MSGPGASGRGKPEPQPELAQDRDEPHGGRRLPEQGEGTALAITDSTTIFPAGAGAAAPRRERATWVLSSHGGRWLIEAYHGCPEDAA